MDAMQQCEIATAEDRICPSPPVWAVIWKKFADVCPEHAPPPPLILAAWGESSDDAKGERLHEQISWAGKFGCLEMLRDSSF